MAKKSVFDHRISGPLMRGMHHIPVDRDAGLASYRQALAALKDGEVVGVFPEATISRSFTLKDIKSGATRMAAAAGVPIVPMALWGSQRLWTKGRPRPLTRRHTPISIAVGRAADRPTADRATPPWSSCGGGCRSCSMACSATTLTSRPGRRTAGGCRPISAERAPTPEEAEALDSCPPGLTWSRGQANGRPWPPRSWRGAR